MYCTCYDTSIFKVYLGLSEYAIIFDFGLILKKFL